MYPFSKRLFDILFSASVLILGLPAFALIALIIRCSARGPIFYLDNRVGMDGRLFRCVKYRTMALDASQRLTELLQSCPQSKLEWELYQKLKLDPRITPIGRFLRKTSLDELPQFWNVLKGDMSVVGPRPVTAKELEERFGPKASKILTAKPGITGYWQTSGRSNISYEERIQLEEEYIDRRSFWFDLKLVAKTVPAMILSKDAH